LLGETAVRVLRDSLRTGAGSGFKTAVAAWLSYVSAQAVGLHEGYWAAISAVVVLQSDLPSTRISGRDRFVGTAIGGVIGWAGASLWHEHPSIYAVSVGLAVLVCALFRVGTAGRLAAVTVSIIILIPHPPPLWKIALLRFSEVSWGIVVALFVAYLGARYSDWSQARATPTQSGPAE
jgi:uncharacterized membrane protein YgaE (UPF0421/DUF939 family)